MVTMRIAQIVLPGASEYERKCQRVDFAALLPKHEVALVSIADARGFDVAHIYAGPELPSRELRSFPIPYVASADVRRSRWPFGRPVEPEYVVSPLGTDHLLPEAVEDSYFEVKPAGSGLTLGTFGPRRPGITKMVELTLARIHRFRDDVDWNLYDAIPSPAALAGVDVWVDPATAADDFDGYPAEALVVGLPVVASRTPLNSIRLEQGRTGFLVPPDDPNEMTHAILAALFKKEIAEARQQAARQTMSKFRPRQRLRVLSHMYETLIS
jgi:Glycosyl transferases group 1